jgi:hypothetical protein
MRNNERLQQLGFKFVSSLVASPTVFSPVKRNDEGSRAEYDPEVEEDLT